MQLMYSVSYYKNSISVSCNEVWPLSSNTSLKKKKQTHNTLRIKTVFYGPRAMLAWQFCSRSSWWYRRVTLLYFSSGPEIDYWLPLFHSVDLYNKTQSPLALLLMGIISLFWFSRRPTCYPKELTLLMEKPLASLGLSALSAAAGHFHLCWKTWNLHPECWN